MRLRVLWVGVGVRHGLGLRGRRDFGWPEILEKPSAILRRCGVHVRKGLRYRQVPLSL